MLKKYAALGVAALVLLRWRSICPWAKRNVAQSVPHTLGKEAPNRIGVILINLGTPTKPTPWFVRKFLIEFLCDWRVIDALPSLARAALVYLVITPIRCFTSGRSYKELWRIHENTSPLLTHSQKTQQMVQRALGPEYVVVHGMRYQLPSLASAMNTLCEQRCRSLIVLPMFAQYASSSSGSAIEWAMRFIGQWDVIPHTHVISHFYSNEKYLDALARTLSPGGSGRDILSFDCVLFSFHGLPWRHVTRLCDNCRHIDPTETPFPQKYAQSMNNAVAHECMAENTDGNAYCYRAHCYATARGVAERLGLPDSKYTVIFQSRFGSDPWLQPYAEDVIRSLPSQGVKRVAIIGPSFVTDCLETTCELGEEYKEAFLEEGGEEWFLFPALNDGEHWAQAVAEMIREKGELLP
uniref:Ferrochelatase n=1 Tax=Perkinsela sp. SMB-60 TaxID=1840652 RepID=A0A167HD06_9EUGL|nr:ferrochelatase [Perkinsela sp. SMB-60]